MEIGDAVLLACLLAIAILIWSLGFFIGICFAGTTSYGRAGCDQKKSHVNEIEIVQRSSDVTELPKLFRNPSSHIYHKEGCRHVGPQAAVLQPCKHCLCNASIYKAE